MSAPTRTIDDAAKPARIAALDVFRGMTILAMILVNNPGSWSHIYAPLRHADWHGWTPTDLVFPFFLFIVGVAIVLSVEGRRERGVERGVLLRAIWRRAAVLFGLGIFLNAFPFVKDFVTFDLKEWQALRIPGVLQRIGLCYGIVATAVLFARPRELLGVTLTCLFGYWALMTLVPVPGVTEWGIHDKDTHLAAYIDRAVFGTHLWVGAKTWDPEGLLSTLPALATTLMGVATGRVLRSDAARSEQVRTLMIRGALLVVAGYVWGWFFPINKPIWTSSYAVFTAGQAICTLALCMHFVDVKKQTSWTRPFVAYGVNPITVFVMSGVIGRLLYTIRVDVAGESDLALKTWIYESCFTSWIDAPKLASLAFAMTWVALWYLVLSWMLRRDWIVKV